MPIRNDNERPGAEPEAPEPVSYSTLAMEAPLGLGVATFAGIVLGANRALHRTLGCPADTALVGTSLARFHSFPELAADILRERLEDGEVEGLEMDALRADGTGMVLRVNARFHELPSGELTVAFSAEDVTRLREEREVSSHGHKMEAVVRFAAGVAHDYNNLLTAIIGEARQLIAEVPDAAVGATEILTAARRAGTITKRLLVFSKSEVARTELVSLNQAVGAVSESLHGQLAPEINVLARLGEDVDAVRIDPGHLEQILSSLASNAVEAMPGGGRLVFETAIMDAPTETEGLDFDPPVPPGRYLSVAIGDNGIGMNQETRRRAFDPFFTTKQIGGGAGLGLTTVYGHVLRAGGHLSVLSAPAHGTVVRVLFPARVVPVDTVVSATRGTPRKVDHKPTVLVVDDEASVLRVMGKVLRRSGYEVVEAHDAFEAQCKLTALEGAVDLVVSDVMMPRMLGTELAQLIAADWPEVRVLFVSGYTDSPMIQEWVDRDPGVFLAKPFEPEELLAAVERRLGLASSQAPSI